MQIDDQQAVSSAAQAQDQDQPIQLGPEEQSAFLSRPDRNQTAEQFFSERAQKKADPVPAKSEATPEAAKPEPDAGKKQRGIDGRIQELKELLAATKDIRQQRRAEQPAQPEQAPPVAVKQPEAAKPPKLAEFEDYEAYEAARDAYQEQLADAKAEAKFKAYVEKQNAEREAAVWNDRATKAGVDPKQLAEAANAYAALVEAGEMPAFTQTMLEAINDSALELGPAVAMHLIGNPEEVKRIAGLGFVGQVNALGEIAASIKGESPTPARRVVSIGTPVKRISAATLPPSELSGGAPDMDLMAGAAAANNLDAWRAAKKARGGFPS